jgi:hypothetical protein
LNRTLNKPQTQSLAIVDSIEETLDNVREIFDSYSIRKFNLSIQGKQFKIIVPTEYYIPKICLNNLESKGYSLETIHGDEKGLEITIGGIRK